MGGSVHSGGNSTAWAEANAYGDPEAAHIVLSSGLPLLLYPWDVFLKVQYTRCELEALNLPEANAKFDRPASSLLASRLLYALMRTFHADAATIGDGGAVASVLCPEALTVRPFHIAVELHGGATRGMTVCD